MTAAPFVFVPRVVRLLGWIAGAAAFFGGVPGRLSAAPLPHAEILLDSFDFGSVKQGQRVTHAFTVSNGGDAALRFSGAELSLPGMQVRFAPAEIAPGAQGTVTLECNTEHLAGTVEGVARIRWNDPARPQALLTLKGAVVPHVSIEPLPAVFISSYANERAERVLTIRNNDAQPLAVTSAQSGPHATASIATVEAGKVYSVTVRPAAGAAAGHYEETLALSTDAAAVGTITLPLHIWIKPDLYANPETVDFGTVALPASASAADQAPVQSVVLRRRSGAFEIKSIRSDIPQVQVTSSPKGPSGSFTLAMRLRADTSARSSTIDGQVHVATSDPAYPEIVIPVTASIVAPAAR